MPSAGQNVQGLYTAHPILTVYTLRRHEQQTSRLAHAATGPCPVPLTPSALAFVASALLRLLLRHNLRGQRIILAYVHSFQMSLLKLQTYMHAISQHARGRRSGC